MLFLDDFLEMLEELPQEMLERGREIQRIDYIVEARLKRNREAVDEFFGRSGITMSSEERIARFKMLQEEFARLRALGEEKYNIAKKMQELLGKYRTHLEKEKTNFQCEMEADNSGVTEIIEKRYTAYLEGLIAARKEQRKRKHVNGSSSSKDGLNGSGALSRDQSEKIARLLQESGAQTRMRDFSDDSASHSLLSSSVPSPAPRGRPPKNGYNRENTMNNNSLMLSSALVANDDSFLPATPTGTQGRRRSTANQLRGSVSIPFGMSSQNNASISRLSPNVSERSWSNMGVDDSPIGLGPPSFSIGTPQTPTMPAFVGSESRHGRTRKLTSRVQEMFKETLQRQRNHQPTPTHGNSILSIQDRMQSSQQSHQTSVDGDEEEGSDDDEEESEDSRRWCFCNEKSYGEMVACDNKTCPYMWFHYPCVGVVAPPKGKWYCPHCARVNEQESYASSPSTSLMPSSSMGEAGL